jgi:hypothetical protein
MITAALLDARNFLEMCDSLYEARSEDFDVSVEVKCVKLHETRKLGNYLV